MAALTRSIPLRLRIGMVPNPDVPPGGLGIQLCSSGINCNDSEFDFVVTSNTVAGDDGGFYSPYILDPHSSTSMLVGTCRVWRGPRLGGAFVALSPNFDTLGSGTCSGSEVNQVRALATGGVTDSSGSSVIYAATSGLGPLEGPLETPAGGRIWVSTDASAGIPAFADVTNNGLQGNINPNQYPISSVATDSSDATGNTAYLTVMGFTGGTGHVWKTTNAGATWTDFTANLPDSPANAVVVYPPLSQVYVATDVGVLGSSTITPSWTELGPAPNTNQPGFLPNVAVTALGVFAAGGQQLLRASTYGRGIWQFNLVVTPDFQLVVSNTPMTVFAGQSATFNGTVTAQNGYTNSVSLSCVAGTTAPPSTCSPSPLSLTPGSKTPFTVTVAGASGDYTFNIQAAGADINHITHVVPVTLHLVSVGLSTPSPVTETVPRGTTSSPVSFQVTAAGSFNQSVTVSCSTNIANATCTLTPASTVYPTAANPVAMTASVAVPAATAVGSYPVTIQATTAGASPLTTLFTLNVTANPDFILSEPTPFPEVNVGSDGTTGLISIASQDGFSGTVTLTCPETYGVDSCSISPSIVSSFPGNSTLTINATSLAAGAYALTISGTSGSVVHALPVAFNVGDYLLSAPQTLTAVPGTTATAILKLTSSFSYSGKINATCDASALPSATCTLSPGNPISLASGGVANFIATVNTPNDAATGTYNIKINAQDTTGAPTHSATIALTLEQDFLVKSSTPSQTVSAGQTSGPYNLTVQPIGSSFSSPVSLACTSGLPPQAQCSFSPSGPVTPGNSAVDVVMSISTKSSKAAVRSERSSMFFSMLLLFPALFSVWVSSPRDIAKRKRLILTTVLLVPVILSLLSCGGVSTAGNGSSGTGSSPTSPMIYQVTLTGTSPGTPPDAGQSTVVTLVVN